MSNFEDYVRTTVRSIFTSEEFHAIFDPTYLCSVKEAFELHDWDFNVEPGTDTLTLPEGVQAKTFAGKALEYYEPKTGKFVRDVTGPFGDSGFLPEDIDENEIERDDEEYPIVMLVGVREVEDFGGPIEQKLATPVAYEKMQAYAVQSLMGRLGAQRSQQDEEDALIADLISKLGARGQA
jgi:hypothetical protein